MTFINTIELFRSETDPSRSTRAIVTERRFFYETYASKIGSKDWETILDSHDPTVSVSGMIMSFDVVKSRTNDGS